MKAKILPIISAVVIISIVLCIYFYQENLQAAGENRVITDITNLCNSKKVIIDGKELSLKINKKITMSADELKSKYGIIQTSKDRVLMLAVSIVGENKEILYNKENPMIVTYSTQKDGAKIDEEEMTWEIYKQILIADCTEKYKEKANDSTAGSMTVLDHKANDIVKAITVNFYDKGFKIKYNVDSIKDGVLEVKSDKL